jgi:cell wall-associated NlpC family hydrolase
MSEAIFADETISKKLVEVLQTWEGTPFVPYMAKKQVGCDCLRFAHAVYKELGIAKDVTWPKYSMQSANRDEFEKLCAFIETTGKVESQDIKVLPKHGDMLVFSSGKVIHHTGIFVDPGRVWNCFPRVGVEQVFVGDWIFMKHLKKIYRPIK